MADDEATEETTEPRRRQWSAARKAAQERRRSGVVDVQSTKADIELVAEDVIGEAVDNVKSLAGMFLLPIAPVTGVTLAGVPAEGYEPGPNDWKDAPSPSKWVVASRADMMGRALLPQAQRNPRLLAMVDRLNRMLRSAELLEAAGAVVASVVVDAGIAPPDAAVLLPGGIQYPIFAPVIGDTLSYLAAQQNGAVPQDGVRLDPRPDRGSAASPLANEPTAEQRREAAETRRRLEARNRAVANGEPDPGLRREGQTVIPGGVEDT